LEKARAGRNKAYSEFLNGPVKDFVMPFDTDIYGRDAIVWAASDNIIPKQSKSEQTARLDGVMVPYTRVGSVIHSVLHRTSLPFEWNRLDQLDFAAPGQIIWGYKPRAYYAIDEKAYTFWVGVPNYTNLEELLNLDLDLYFHFERGDDGLVYAICIVRTETDYVEWQQPVFHGVSEQLHKQGGSWRRISSDDIREAFRVFVPGASPPNTNLLNQHWYRHSLPQLRHQVPLVNEILPQLTRRVRLSDDVGGDIFIGRYGDAPVFMRSAKKNNWLFTAQTETGKTTLSNLIALEQSSFVASLDLTAKTEEESVHVWAEEFGGKSVLWADLTDVSQPVDDLAKIRNKEILLLQQDQENARLEVEAFFEQCRREGWPELPLGIFTDSPTIRYYNKVDAFLKHLVYGWQPYWKETGEKLHLKVDDWASIPKSTDVYLGDLPVQVGNNLRNTIRWLEDNCRKFGVVFYGIAHTDEEIDADFPAGTRKSFNTHIVLRQNSYKVDVLDPARDVYIARNMDTRLPRTIVKVIGR
jgi:hypothetical protein